MAFLIRYIARILPWMLTAVTVFFPLQVFKTLCGGLVAVLNVIPMPAWLTGNTLDLSPVGAGVAYFLQLAQVPTALGIIGSAYLLRFLIRRIPFFG